MILFIVVSSFFLLDYISFIFSLVFFFVVFISGVVVSLSHQLISIFEGHFLCNLDVSTILPFGQMSFWGATVITNLLSPFPSLIEWVSGGHYVYNPTLKRFFIFHFQFPFLLCGFRILHLFYLHFLSSNNPLRNSTNNKIPFFPFIFQKDFFGFILILCLYLLQTHFGISSFSHPDNALEVCGLLTPLHIVPEWYFLCQYAMLKAVPNKNAGFIILLTSIFTFFFFGEIRNLTTLCLLPLVNNGFSLSSFFLSLLSFLWIGAQFPQEKFLSYGRIFTSQNEFPTACLTVCKHIDFLAIEVEISKDVKEKR
jgi:ubiquinol-cytochrome c reductase cytochrome b subunit